MADLAHSNAFFGSIQCFQRFKPTVTREISLKKKRSRFPIFLEKFEFYNHWLNFTIIGCSLPPHSLVSHCFN